MSITLRVATRADIAGMQRVRGAVRENRLVSRVITDDEVRAAIEDTGRGWVALDSDQVIGFAIGHAGSGNIWALFLDPAFEGRGIGRRLHDVMVDWLFAQGLTRLHLDTAPNTRAARFYTTAGWRLVGTDARGELCFELSREVAVTTPDAKGSA